MYLNTCTHTITAALYPPIDQPGGRDVGNGSTTKYRLSGVHWDYKFCKDNDNQGRHPLLRYFETLSIAHTSLSYIT